LFSFVFFSFEELFFPHFGGKNNNFLKFQQLRWVKILEIILHHLGNCTTKGLGWAIHGNVKQGVCHIVALPFRLKIISRQKKNYGNSKISPCKKLIFK